MGEGDLGGRGHTYTYGQFMLLLIHQQKPTQYCKAIIPQLKIISFFFKAYLENFKGIYSKGIKYTVLRIEDLKFGAFTSSI